MAKRKRHGKRRASPAQLRALAKGRAKMATKRARFVGGNPGRGKRKATHYKHAAPRTEVVVMGGKMGGKKRRKRHGRGRYMGGLLPVGGKGRDMINRARDVSIGVAGAVGGAMLTKYIPVADLRIKAAIPLIGGIVLSSMVANRMIQSAGAGLAIAGGLALVKAFAPNVAVLAGEGEADPLASLTEDQRLALLENLSGEDDDDTEGEDDDDAEDMRGAVADFSGAVADFSGTESGAYRTPAAV